MQQLSSVFTMFPSSNVNTCLFQVSEGSPATTIPNVNLTAVRRMGSPVDYVTVAFAVAADEMESDDICIAVVES